MSDVLFEGGGYRVTSKILKTPRKSISLAQLEYVAVEYSLRFVAGVPAVAMIAFALRFGRYLSAIELPLILAVSAAGIWAAMRIGTLRVHSFALQDQDTATYGFIRHLHSVRLAVEQAMETRGQGGGA